MPLKLLKEKKGVSLMELTIMIAVGAILMVSMSRAAQTIIKSAVDMRNYMVALNLAKMQMAIMNNSAYPAVGTTTPASDASFPNFTFSQVVTNVATSQSNNLNQIQMDVKIGTNVIVRLYTYRTNTVGTPASGVTNYGFADGL